MGKFEWHDGSEYEGGWKNGKQHGKEIYTSVDGTKQKGEWKDRQFQPSQAVDESDMVEIIGALSAADIVAKNVKAAEANGEVIEIL